MKISLDIRDLILFKYMEKNMKAWKNIIMHHAYFLSLLMEGTLIVVLQSPAPLFFNVVFFFFLALFFCAIEIS